MTRPLSLSSPVSSLLAASGLPLAELARRRGIRAQSILSAVRSGPGAKLSTLAALAAAAGGRLEVRYVPAGEGEP